MNFGPDSAYRINGSPTRGRALLAPYAIEVTMDNGAVLELGRFSLGVLDRLKVAVQGHDGLVFRCGAFCEVADARILVGGEHDNDSLWNISLRGPAQVFGKMAGEDGVLPVTPTILGDNVLISERALLMSGVRVGDGAVVGAGAVVTRDCEALAVYAGSPARRLRARFGEALADIYPRLRLGEVQAEHVPRLGKLVRAVERGEMSLDDYLSEVSFVEKKAVLHYGGFRSHMGIELQLKSASVDGAPVEAEAFQRMSNYLLQDTRQDFEWTPDIFRTLGLC